MSGTPARGRQHAHPERLLAGARHIIDLVRRAHAAPAACLVDDHAEPYWSTDQSDLPEAVRSQALTAAATARRGGRDHVAQVLDGHFTVISAGYAGAGCAVIARLSVAEQVSDAILHDLQAFVAECAVDVEYEHGTHELPDWLIMGSESIAGIASRLAEVVAAQCGRPVAVMVRDPVLRVARIHAVAGGTDHRLLGVQVSATSAAGRACMGGTTVRGVGLHDLLGLDPFGRRRWRGTPGVALPINHHGEGLGAAIVFGGNPIADPEVLGSVRRFLDEGAARIDRAVARSDFRREGLVDPVAHLFNREGFEQVLQGHEQEPHGILRVRVEDLDAIADEYGPRGVDAALQYTAQLLQRCIRDGDVAARVTDAEFSILLPATPATDAGAVADRIRADAKALVIPWGQSSFGAHLSIEVTPESAIPD
ncbi:MAG TPA: GGDEF domain-containing protein [Gemmatimonadales bacterium]